MEAQQSGFFDSILAALLRPIVSHLAKPTSPRYNGRAFIDGLRTKVDVVWDIYGVPHVFAANERDLFLAQGYLHAQERLWQMDTTRRFLTGRLAEVFGSLPLPWKELSILFCQRTLADFDYFIRLIGIRRAALASLDVLADEDRLKLNDYSEGVNRYIEQCGKRLPWEFRLLRYQPDPWRPEDSIGMVKGMAFFLSTALFTRLSMIAVAAKLDGDHLRLRSLFPSYPEDGPTVIRTVWNSTKTVWQFISGTFAQSHWHSAGHGSNSWAIAPSRSKTGRAILCNDPHLRMTLPGVWYLMHLKAASSEAQPAGYEVWGASIPGSPYIHVGHNRWIAWGITAAACDDVELYREKIHRLDPNLYLAGEQWRAMDNRWETIRVRGVGNIYRNIRQTRHGPVISDFDASARKSPEVIAFRWTAQAPSTEFRCLYGVNCARDWRNFLESLSDQSAPALSYVYADQQGNIGYTLAGKIPLRSQTPSLLPVEGWRAADDWHGYIPFNELPRLYNPPQGVIASANHKIEDTSYPYYLSLFYEPPFRIRRILTLLAAKKRLSLDDMATMQRDTVSLHARALINALKIDLQSISADARVVMEASDRLIRWNGQCEADSVEAAIFHVFHQRLMANLLVPVLGEELFHSYIEIFNQCITPIDKILADPDSPWFTGRKRRELVSGSLREACDELTQILGDKPSSWRWGKIHTLLLNHALGRLKVLKPFLAVGPFPSPGDGTTLNIGFYRHSHPYDQIVGASLRMLIDVGNWQQTKFVLPAGQSGHFISPHYKDQTILWRSGQCISLFLDMNQKNSLRCLTLQPAMR